MNTISAYQAASSIPSTSSSSDNSTLQNALEKIRPEDADAANQVAQIGQQMEQISDNNIQEIDKERQQLEQQTNKKILARPASTSEDNGGTEMNTPSAYRAPAPAAAAAATATGEERQRQEAESQRVEGMLQRTREAEAERQRVKAEELQKAIASAKSTPLPSPHAEEMARRLPMTTSPLVDAIASAAVGTDAAAASNLPTFNWSYFPQPIPEVQAPVSAIAATPAALEPEASQEQQQKIREAIETPIIAEGLSPPAPITTSPLVDAIANAAVGTDAAASKLPTFNWSHFTEPQPVSPSTSPLDLNSKFTSYPSNQDEERIAAARRPPELEQPTQQQQGNIAQTLRTPQPGPQPSRSINDSNRGIVAATAVPQPQLPIDQPVSTTPYSSPARVKTSIPKLNNEQIAEYIVDKIFEENKTIIQSPIDKLISISSKFAQLFYTKNLILAQKLLSNQLIINSTDKKAIQDRIKQQQKEDKLAAAPALPSNGKIDFNKLILDMNTRDISLSATIPPAYLAIINSYKGYGNSVGLAFSQVLGNTNKPVTQPDTDTTREPSGEQMQQDIIDIIAKKAVERER